MNTDLDRLQERAKKAILKWEVDHKHRRARHVSKQSSPLSRMHPWGVSRRGLDPRGLSPKALSPRGGSPRRVVKQHQLTADHIIARVGPLPADIMGHLFSQTMPADNRVSWNEREKSAYGAPDREVSGDNAASTVLQDLKPGGTSPQNACSSGAKSSQEHSNVSRELDLQDLKPRGTSPQNACSSGAKSSQGPSNVSRELDLNNFAPATELAPGNDHEVAETDASRDLAAVSVPLVESSTSAPVPDRERRDERARRRQTLDDFLHGFAVPLDTVERLNKQDAPVDETVASAVARRKLMMEAAKEEYEDKLAGSDPLAESVSPIRASTPSSINDDEVPEENEFTSTEPAGTISELIRVKEKVTALRSRVSIAQEELGRQEALLQLNGHW